MSLDLNEITKAYLNIRDARASLRRQYETSDADLAESQRKLTAVMLSHINDTGVESVRTASGTFYREKKLKPSGSDWEAFYKWIAEENAFDALERRIKAAFIKEYMDDNDGALPPGVSVHHEYEVRVRKAT